ncbi:MAG TPA: response regulator [Candidatus Deferrimicrobium sp.]|nr:response regulator [Candidatus Deferrimicrobium sp.]
MKKKILLLEDNIVHREVIYDGLEDMGFEVKKAEDVPEARKIIDDEGFKPDLFVLDIVIGVIKNQGILYAEKLSKKPGFKDIPVLYITAHFDQKDIAGYFPEDLRANVLLKPFDFEQLLNKIRQVLNK